MAGKAEPNGYSLAVVPKRDGGQEKYAANDPHSAELPGKPCHAGKDHAEHRTDRQRSAAHFWSRNMMEGSVIRMVDRTQGGSLCSQETGQTPGKHADTTGDDNPYHVRDRR